MKHFFLAVLVLTISTASFSQSEKYNQAMTKNLQLIDSVKSANDALAASQAFERIAEAEKHQWLPYY